MRPALRRLVYVLAFEGIGIVLVGIGLAAVSGAAVTTTGSFALVSSLIAAAWNYLYNTGYEAWEARQPVRGRPLGRRIAHAVGLEAGLLTILTPLMAWWLSIPLLEALLYDIGATLAFLGYAFVFNLGFDTLFGLPRSAR